jgi:anti-sigma factor ChrR (cupin superfamily)
MDFSVINSTAIEWQPSTFAKGVWVKNLGQSDGYALQLVKFAPKSSFPAHVHLKAEFMYILEGEIMQNGCVLAPGFVSVAESGTFDKEVTTEQGCIFLIFSAA